MNNKNMNNNKDDKEDTKTAYRPYGYAIGKNAKKQHFINAV